MGVVENVGIISDPHAECHTAWQLGLPSFPHGVNAVGPVCVYAAFTVQSLNSSIALALHGNCVSYSHRQV